MTCVVSEGDSPIHIVWHKDGKPLASYRELDVATNQISEYDLALRIPSASPAHNGNYTCLATNDAAKAMRTERLLVHGTSNCFLWGTRYIICELCVIIRCNETLSNWIDASMREKANYNKELAINGPLSLRVNLVALSLSTLSTKKKCGKASAPTNKSPVC